MPTIASWQLFTLLIVFAALAHTIADWLWRRGGEPRSPQKAASGPDQHTLAITAGICMLLFAALTTALLTGSFIAVIDQHIRSWVQVLQDEAFIGFCTFITSLADVAALTGVTLVAAGLLWSQARRRDMAGLAVSVLGSQATTYIAKYAIARERPEFEAFAHAVTPSYPSAHASSAVAVYGFIILLVTRPLPHTRLHFEIGFWGTGFILLIAASRIVLGVHYASDVVAGLLVGLFWLLAGMIASRREHR